MDRNPLERRPFPLHLPATTSGEGWLDVYRDVTREAVAPLRIAKRREVTLEATGYVLAGAIDAVLTFPERVRKASTNAKNDLKQTLRGFREGVVMGLKNK